MYTDIDPQELVRDNHNMKLIASGVKPNRPGRMTLAQLRGMNDKIWMMLVQYWDLSPAFHPPIVEVLRALMLKAEETMVDSEHDSLAERMSH